MLEGVGEPRPSVRCADAGVLLRGVPTADSPRGDSPMASRPLAVGCVPIYTAELHFHRDETRRVDVASFRCARRIGHFRACPAARRPAGGGAAGAAQLGSRRAPSVKMKTKHKSHSFRSHQHKRGRAASPVRTQAPRSPMHARESRRLRPSRRGLIRPDAWLSRSRRGVHTHTHMRPRRRLAAAASRRVGAYNEIPRALHASFSAVESPSLPPK